MCRWLLTVGGGGLNCLMITLNTYGLRGVYSVRNYYSGYSLHDVWGAHGSVIPSPNINVAFSGDWYLSMDFTLLDIVTYTYFYAVYPDYDSALQAAGDYAIYVNPDGLVGYVGEWWNFVARQQVFQKIPTSEKISWLNSH